MWLFVFHFIIYFLSHPECYFPKCKLSQLQDVGRTEEIVESCLYLLLGIYLACLQTFHKFFGCQVYVHHLVGLAQHAVGDALLHIHTYHLAHLVVQTLDMLDVYRRYHTDAGIEQFHHILPSFGVAAAFHIGVGKFIHYHDVGMNLQDGIKIHLLNLLTLIEHLLSRNNR